MRYIDNSKVCTPSDWNESSKHAYEYSKGDIKKINEKSSVWKSLKEKLSDISYGKCWYCEVKEIRSDNPVDHFRPKSIYPWLAFEKNNFRYSCTYCNSKRINPSTKKTQGKGDSFPLFNQSKKAIKKRKLKYEDPCLLDPCNRNDPNCLDFLDEGTPCPKYAEHEKLRKKAELSIHFYHLDHPEIIEKRRKFANELKQKIHNANLFFEFSEKNPEFETAFGKLKREINDSMSAEAELSAFARKVISGRRDLRWIEDLLKST